MKKAIRTNLIVMLIIVLFWCTISFAEASAQETNPQETPINLESDKYIIDYNENIIYRIIPQTNIDNFKSKFNIPDKIKVYEDKTCQKEIEKGNIGTGMAVKNTTDGEIYEISVIADFNSDSISNQVELSQIIRHVIGMKEYQLTGAKLKSADINNDGKVNNIDITLLIRYNVYGELNISENLEVKSPSINILSGVEGKNDWYVSEVNFKIGRNEDISKFEKNTYKIIGTKNTEEKEIEENEEITLQQGIYEIIAYTYTKEGYKSFSTRRTINIDTTKPECGTLKITTNDGDYTDGIWTNSDITIAMKEGTDRESGHQSTTYSVKNSDTNDIVIESTNQTSTITESGNYIAKIETQDNAGNISSQEYTIKIDKNITAVPKIEVTEGTRNQDSAWYISDVTLQITQGTQKDSGSQIQRNTYKIEGTQQVAETEIENGGTISLTQNGIYQITAYSYNEAGQKSEGKTIEIKIDKDIPEAPNVRVTQGTQNENNIWYIDPVTLQVEKPADGQFAKIVRLTYTIEGTEQVVETEIADAGTIQIPNDGVYTIKVYSYNEAETRSEAKQIIIQKDGTIPKTATIESSNIGPTNFTLTARAEDETSGIKEYKIYLDDILISTTKTAENTKEIQVTDQTSGIHRAYVIVTDEAGNSKQSDTIEIETTRLTIKEVDHLEFVVTSYILQDEQQEIVDSGITAIISDTSLTSSSKYIMLNATEENITGTVRGKLKLVRKDGTIVENFKYFPEDLQINMAYYANGSGTTFTHDNQVEFFETNLNPSSVPDGTEQSTSITISQKTVDQNNFIITEKKTSGTQTYTRATIKSLKMGDKSLEFKIVQE